MTSKVSLELIVAQNGSMKNVRLNVVMSIYANVRPKCSLELIVAQKVSLDERA